ncbi:hypothetical protein D7221_14420 [Legionella pneumophila]|nr:hypothetical protein BE842_01640 [Legionella pneumophila subsp. pneumophila]AOW62273.1 hypothetical protein BE844_14445 [Legionella pneumophila subsp. pneumophila]AOW67672.1 hypothetical protein BE846_12195 [Legionella pneumophila subsp. pneumophila]RYW85187.1 hypothetical protein D7221_14420 [Legionella pneumophila]
MCAVAYLVQSITNFVPNIKKLVNYCLFLCFVHEQKISHARISGQPSINIIQCSGQATEDFLLMHRDFAADSMTLSSKSFIEFSNHQDCHGVNF